MCTVPEAPPPPPPLPLNNSYSVNKRDNRDITPRKLKVCEWATDPELQEACALSSLCLHNPPFRHKYKHFKSIIQNGPTCGLVALSMIINGEVSADEMLNITKLEGYSNNGEMFSCRDMVKLADKVFSLAEIENVSVEMRKGGLFSEEVIWELLDGAVLLIAYDADCNHSPCLRQGHTAHWALVCGVIIVDDPGESYLSNENNIYVLCRHGKSKYLATWTLHQLDKSNKNLREFSPKKKEDGLLYVLPEGGMGGDNGLRDQFLIFKGL